MQKKEGKKKKMKKCLENGHLNLDSSKGPISTERAALYSTGFLSRCCSDHGPIVEALSDIQTYFVLVIVLFLLANQFIMVR